MPNADAPFPHGELARRLPVWIALAELFTGRALDARDDAQLLRALVASGYDAATLDAILWDEVAPAFAGNVYAPAPELLGWSDRAVRDAVLAHRRSRSGLGRRLQRWWLRRHPAHVHARWAVLRRALARDT